MAPSNGIAPEWFASRSAGPPVGRLWAPLTSTRQYLSWRNRTAGSMRCRSAGSSPKGSSPASMSSVTTGAALSASFPPPRTRFPSFRERDRRSADDQTFGLFAFEPHVELDGPARVVLLRDGGAQADRPIGQHEPAKRRSEPAKRAGSRPRLEKAREKTHAHVPGRDHARQPLAARALVVGETRRPLAAGACVGAHLVLREEERAGGQLVAFLDVVEANTLRHHRCMKRLSTMASISPRWFESV